MFSTEGQKAKQGGGQNRTFEPGVVLAHIFNATVKTAKTGKKMLELVLEGPALPNFEGWAIDRENQEGPKFKGQTAKVSATIYIDSYNSNDVNVNEIMRKLLVLSDEVGLRSKIDNITKVEEINSIEQWVERAVNILKGEDLYFFLVGKEEEYNGKTIIKLSLPKFKFCASDESKLNKFDKNNKYHYTSLENKTIDSFATPNDDFNI